MKRQVVMAERAAVMKNMLGSLGLMLVGLIGWASERSHRGTVTDVVLAGLVIGFATVVGWLVERLPPTGHDRLGRGGERFAAAGLVRGTAGVRRE